MTPLLCRVEQRTRWFGAVRSLCNLLAGVEIGSDRESDACVSRDDRGAVP